MLTFIFLKYPQGAIHIGDKTTTDEVAGSVNVLDPNTRQLLNVSTPKE